MATLANIKAKHGIDELAFFASKEEGSNRCVASDDATGIIFITVEDFDPSKDAYAYLAKDGDDFTLEDDEVIYWVSNKAGEAKYTL